MAGAMALLLVACAQPARPQVTSPGWLQLRIAGYETGPEQAAPSAIWKIQHHGQAAYYVVSPCCDQFNPLWDARGEVICHPDGGFTGRGDGQCPEPRDAGTPATLMWSDPRKPAPEAEPWGQAR